MTFKEYPLGWNRFLSFFFKKLLTDSCIEYYASFFTRRSLCYSFYLHYFVYKSDYFYFTVVHTKICAKHTNISNLSWCFPFIIHCWREIVFKIVTVQVPTKSEMWQNYVAFVFVITYVLQAMWPCAVYILIIDHRPLFSMRVPHVCAVTSWNGGWGKWGLDSRSCRAKN
jgi:hypothetical protein